MRTRNPSLARRARKREDTSGALRRGDATVVAMTGSVSSGMSIGRSTGTCAASGRSLKVGDAYVATLVDRPGEQGAIRLDFSLDAWAAGGRPKAPDRVIGSWRTSMRAPSTESKQLLSDDELLELFEEMVAASEPKHFAFRYVLALMLIRRRQLRLIGEKQADGKGVLLVRRKLPLGGVAALTSPEGPAMEVVDPGLDEATTIEVIEQLGQVLGGGADGAGRA